MPKPKRIDRPVKKLISFPTSLITQVELMLYSELEGRVPHGALSEYVQELVAKDLLRRMPANVGAPHAAP